ncbi:MAG: hypothetical protein LAP87_14650 [Acidobacteriia bacterium]|nr:hypothetical protein [Terriglobia bacterium]
METSPTLKSDFTYFRYLAKAVLDGVTSPPKGTGNGPFKPVLRGTIWTSTAIGAAIGVLNASLSRRHKSGYRVAAEGMVGSALGFGAGVAWASRDFTGAVTRSTIQKVNSVRDARWLEKNPITYA